MRFCLVVGFCLLLMGCSTIGAPDEAAFAATDFGAREPLRIVVLQDDGVSDELSSRLLGQITMELAPYGIDVVVPWSRPWRREAFADQALMVQLGKELLEPPCDRLLALIGRTAGDFLLGLVGFETLGAVDLATHTRAFVAARRASINQVFVSPSRVCVHEAYHLMGCPHDVTLSGCYTRIASLKSVARENREAGNDFFPGVDAGGSPIRTRDEANWLIQFAIWRYQERDERIERSCSEP